MAAGSNLASGEGSPARTVAAALAALAALGRVAAQSRLWRSPSWPPGGPPFVNAAARLETALAPRDLLAGLHAIEAGFGRERGLRWGPRTLDLDLVAVGDLVLPDAATQGSWAALPPDRQGREAPGELILPHPRMHERGFVLAPLAEVAPGWRHPLLGLSVHEMLAALPPEAVAGLGPVPVTTPGPTPTPTPG